MGRLMEDEDDGLRRRLQAMLVATNKLVVCMIVVFTLHIAGKGSQRMDFPHTSVPSRPPPHPPPPTPPPSSGPSVRSVQLPTHLPNFSNPPPTPYGNAPQRSRIGISPFLPPSRVVSTTGCHPIQSSATGDKLLSP